MRKLELILFLISVVAIAAPIAGVVIVHSDNLSELIFPSEVEEILFSTINTDESIELPQYVSSSYNVSSRTAQATFNFTNPLDFTLTINSLSADLGCANHGFSLGHAALSNEVQLNGGETEDITIIFMWTEAAENHFLNEHASATSIDIELVNIQIDISGISIEIPEQVAINLPIIQ
jgi:hypothetical protein